MVLDRRITFGMTLPQSVLDQIDAERGQVPRVRFIEDRLLKGMEKDHEPRER